MVLPDPHRFLRVFAVEELTAATRKDDDRVLGEANVSVLTNVRDGRDVVVLLIGSCHPRDCKCVATRYRGTVERFRDSRSPGTLRQARPATNVRESPRSDETRTAHLSITHERPTLSYVAPERSPIDVDTVTRVWTVHGGDRARQLRFSAVLILRSHTQTIGLRELRVVFTRKGTWSVGPTYGIREFAYRGP